MSQDIPTQLVTVEPNSDVLDRAVQSYSINQPAIDREDYLKRIIVDSVRLEINLVDETKAKSD